MSIVDPLLVAALVACFGAAAALAIAEVSIVRVRRSEIVVDVQRRRPGSEQLLRLVDDLPIVLNSVLLLVLLLQVAAATIAAYLAGRWFGGFGVTVTTFLLTAVLFVYAEAIPKTIAVRSPYPMALKTTRLLRVVVTVLRAPVAILVRLADLQSPGEEVSFGALTEEEIRMLAREAAEAGEIEAGDVALVERSFEFNDRNVEEVMVDRDRIHAVRTDESVTAALATAVAFGHRRLPIYGRDLDDIVGMARLRDVASMARRSPDSTVDSVRNEVLRCRPDEPISELLGRMQRSSRWLAIVTDEAGNTLGLVTIEDLVAELVGEITDERASLDFDPIAGTVTPDAARRPARRHRRPRS